MNLTWLTDIHLNFLNSEKRTTFYNSIKEEKCDAYLITGDIDEAPTLSNTLKEMANCLKKPIYFVLGNHDYYRGKIDDLRKEMIILSKSENLIHWLPASGPHLLEKNTILLGQDGWADGRYGDYQNNRATINDSRMIIDLFQEKIMGKYTLLKKMQQLADEDAKQLEIHTNQAIKEYNANKIIILTHVPPFKETCLYESKISNDDFLPYFSSKATGDTLLKLGKQYKQTDFLVLCGHTHERAEYQPAENLTIKVGKAIYNNPEIESIITI